MRRVLTVLALALAAAAPAACSPATATATGGGGRLVVPSGTVGLGTPPVAATPSTAATCDGAPFTTVGVSITHTAGLATPIVQGIRPGTHPECGYDRITFDISGAIPGYSVMPVNAVVQDGSGTAVKVPGSSYVLIRFSPARTGSLSTAPVTLSYPILKGYAISGDFEGIVSIALGTDGPPRFRVAQLSGRVYVDVSR